MIKRMMGLFLITCLPLYGWEGWERNRPSSFTVFDKPSYEKVVFEARTKVASLLKQLKAYRKDKGDNQIAFIVSQLADIPYLDQNAMGEGDWQPSQLTYQPGATHINQSPVYRLDGFDCQTFIQMLMASYYSNTQETFDKNMIMIAYGAAGNPNGERVRNYNRNHFIEGDFNPQNERLGFLTDATSEDLFAPYATKTSVTLTRQQFFLRQQNNPNAVRVLQEKDGVLMLKRWHTLYPTLPFPHFRSENITLTYLPKEGFVLQKEGRYLPNHSLLDQIPTPSIAEIVIDVKRWKINGKLLREALGSATTISHVGVLYRQNYQKGEVIYHQIACELNSKKQKECTVTPILCQKKKCNELMFAHATASYPDGFFWYKQSDGKYVCTVNPPHASLAFSRCNRVERLPLFAYLTKYQYGHYWYMDNPALLGIHIERLKTPS